MLALALHPLNLKRLWLFNAGMFVLYLILSVGLPFMKGSVLEYPNVRPAAFNGTVSPVAYVPNWLNAANMVKTLRYEDIASSEFLATPFYDASLLELESAQDKLALLARATYITPYMGSYRMNFKEYDGSHLAVDIRAVLGTPVLSIANGVVVRVVESQNADGKYVVIRHDGITYNGLPPASYYSSYLHLESISVTEGSVVTKGQTIGKVGLTGITTTPHLHFQIDKEDAPFHPYWPYSFKDLRELKLDFFDAVNVGLGKENAMKYTVNPLDFVQSLANGNSTVPSNPTPSAPAPEVSVSATVPKTPQTYVAAVTVAANTSEGLSVGSKVEAPLLSAPQIPTTPVSSPLSSASQAAQASQAYLDVPSRAIYAKAAAYVKSKAVSELADESVFRPTQTLTRREAVLYLAGVFEINPQVGVTSPFADVAQDDPALGYITALQARSVIQPNWIFRPNDPVTKTELIALMLRITGEYESIVQIQGKS